MVVVETACDVTQNLCIKLQTMRLGQNFNSAEWWSPLHKLNGETTVETRFFIGSLKIMLNSLVILFAVIWEVKMYYIGCGCRIEGR